MSGDPTIQAPAPTPPGGGWLVILTRLVGASLLVSQGIVFPLLQRDVSELALVIGAGALGVAEALRHDQSTGRTP